MAPKLAMLEGALIVLASLAASANAARIFVASAKKNNINNNDKVLTASDNAILTDASMASVIAKDYNAELDRMLSERYANEAMLNRTMSVEGAYKIFLQANLTNETTVGLIEEGLRRLGALHSPRLRAHPTKSLVEEKYNPADSLGKANKVLGQMITEASMEYDQLHLECSQFFHQKCGVMETCRQDISSANSLAAAWRSKVLAAQAEINLCEQRLPRLDEDLQTSNKECSTRLTQLRRDLKIVLNDISVMESVINMTQCTGNNAFLQFEDPQLLECTQLCSNTTFATLGHGHLQDRLRALESRYIKRLVQDSLMSLVGLAKEDSANVTNATSPVTVFKNPPLPQAAIPSDPCQGIKYDDPSQGKPSCVLRQSPACFNLQNKFLSIQGETVDRRDELLEEIAGLETDCKQTKANLDGEIQTFTTKQVEEHTKLAESTSGENEATEEGQTKSAQHEELKKAMLTMRTSCSAKFRSLESELCALKKIRGELNKMKGAAQPFFQDCQVADKWEEKECSVDCGGGVQELTRAVITPPSGHGAKCPPVKQVQNCNDQPCPIDCKMASWSGFSACSADCGGGVQMRTRRIEVQGKYQGTPCGDVTHTVPCNMQSCDTDCVLKKWTEWSSCSKACDVGTRERRRIVKDAAIGRGKCPGKNGPERLERKRCNRQACVRDPNRPMVCLSKVDLVLLLDGSGSTGKKGWKSTKAFAKKLMQAFDSPLADSQVSVILFSGPFSYPVLRRCQGGGSGLDMEKDCKIKVVQHFSNDTVSTDANLEKMVWPKGTTLTSAALELANSEFTLGRPDSSKVLLVITDGIPLSARATGMAAKRLRKTARLMFGAVKLETRGMDYLRKWGSKPTNENVIHVQSFAKLESLDTVDTIIADMCPNVTAAASTMTMMPMP